MLSALTCATDGFGWVKGWIQARFGESATAIKYGQSWGRLREYFAECGLSNPTDVTRQVCYDYFLWRTGVARNTAYAELLVLSAVLHEAVLRGLIPANPAVRLGIKRQPPAKRKPEFSLAMLDEIEAATLKEKGKRADFYRISFLIARYHGVRIAETRFPLSWVNFDANTITFCVKGQREHVVPLHPKLRPHLLKLKEEGAGWTFTDPSYAKLMSTLWCTFFRRHGFYGRIPFSCFHALRVTAISRLLRAKIPPDQVMRYVAHSDTETHRLYQRIRNEDLSDCVAALG